MWVYEEKVVIPKDNPNYINNEPQNLTTIINNYKENMKYLPGIKLPSNIHANPSIEDTVKDATILIFNLPHQFISKICDQLKGKILPYSKGISCIKGVEVSNKGIKLFSESISERLNIYCGALSGANIASEVALEKWSETTIGYNDSDNNNNHNELPTLDHKNIKKLFHRNYFHVRVVDDIISVSLGGALKNIIALAAGWVDGLGWGDNAKAAIMRVGLMEEVKFGKLFFQDKINTSTFMEESCGVADIITSCSGGRNFRCAKLSILQNKSINEIEDQELNGQKLQGTSTAYEVNSFLKARNSEKEFPLFTAVYSMFNHHFPLFTVTMFTNNNFSIYRYSQR